VVESGPGGEDLAAGTWQRLEALPDPRSPHGRITRWPAWSRSRSARSPPRGTTGSPRLASGSGGLARKTWPACALRGTRSPAGTGRRMRRRSGSCWPASLRELWPGPCSGHARAVAGVPADRRGQRAQLPRATQCSAGKNAGPWAVKGSGRGRQDLPRGRAAPTAPRCTSSVR